MQNRHRCGNRPWYPSSLGLSIHMYIAQDELRSPFQFSVRNWTMMEFMGVTASWVDWRIQCNGWTWAATVSGLSDSSQWELDAIYFIFWIGAVFDQPPLSSDSQHLNMQDNYLSAKIWLNCPSYLPPAGPSVSLQDQANQVFLYKIMRAKWTKWFFTTLFLRPRPQTHSDEELTCGVELGNNRSSTSSFQCCWCTEGI